MSIFTFKRVSLAKGGYQNVHAKTKKNSDRKQQHKITLQIDEANIDQFHALVQDLDEQIDEAKAELGWGDDHAIRLPWSLEQNTLELAWNAKKHANIKVVELVDGELVELQADEMPNIHDGTVLSVGLSASSRASHADGRYAERVWINVEPDVIYLLDVKTFDRSASAYQIEKDEAFKALADDALDF